MSKVDYQDKVLPKILYCIYILCSSPQNEDYIIIYSLLCCSNIKYDILNNAGNQTVSGPLLFHSIFPPCYGGQWGSATVGYPHY